ncbi:Activin_recp domain-containing protein [Caenorhabditis elegans]|uniref:Activin_recp domain-containing protein n=1 Tax=Caenorhabditis elegans TaxID=6239 RepID=Q564W1_CAEEL|nr:Activin_recp domain-containing protein [Caenorhabditis elegans]CAI79228.1 Activin_recp domain-containing protein [Caenorhabditis elegans]|eukprot:NP_001021449.1 Uncharacterized protein CELE_F35C12.3 [Caenorhabditis elegans]
MLRLFVSLLVIVSGTFAIQCNTGLKFIKGTSVGTATINCENSGAYCYNMTASAASLIEVTKAGCSMWRCMFAQNKCIGTTFQNIPISLCCCNTPLCNAGGEGAIQSQNSGGWNAEPEHRVTNLNKDEVQSRFDSAELDEDHPHGSSSRAARSGKPDTTDPTTVAMEESKNITETSEMSEPAETGEEIDIPLI